MQKLECCDDKYVPQGMLPRADAEEAGLMEAGKEVVVMVRVGDIASVVRG